MHFYTIFQCAQLLERLRAFERSGFPFHELQKGIPPKAVNALMTKGKGAAVLFEWNRRTREIEGVPGEIDNHFDLVGGQRVLQMFKRMRGSDDLDCTIRT